MRTSFRDFLDFSTQLHPFFSPRTHRSIHLIFESFSFLSYQVNIAILLIDFLSIFDDGEDERNRGTKTDHKLLFINITFSPHFLSFQFFKGFESSPTEISRYLVYSVCEKMITRWWWHSSQKSCPTFISTLESSLYRFEILST